MYELLYEIAGTWGLLFLLVLFIAAVAYALWPGNRRKFDRAKQVPLEDESPDGSSPDSGDKEDRP